MVTHIPGPPAPPQLLSFPIGKRGLVVCVPEPDFIACMAAWEQYTQEYRGPTASSRYLKAKVREIVCSIVPLGRFDHGWNRKRMTMVMFSVLGKRGARVKADRKPPAPPATPASLPTVSSQLLLFEL